MISRARQQAKAHALQPHFRTGLLAAVAFSALLSVALLKAAPALGIVSAAPAAAQTGQTIVSITFDDGRATQYSARSLLAANGMHATFYVNSPRLGSSSFYLSWQQVQDLYSDGNEIGGHDAYHADLTQVNSVEAQRQICYDRVNLLNHGIQATDLAYPYGAYNGSVETLVQSCGYNSARTTDTLTSPSVPMPPSDAYAIPSVDGSGSNALSNLETAVTRAEQGGGGWVPVVFHDICSGCSSVSTTASDFSSFLNWLQQQAASGVVVQTVQQVIGGSTQPAVSGPGLPAAPNKMSALRNPSLEYDSNADQAPDCYAFDDFGANNYTWTRTNNAHTGVAAERLDVTNYHTGDNKLEILQDLGTCTPTVTPGHRYQITEWYISDTPVSFTVFARKNDWSFPYWVSSPDFPAASTWTQATWTTPVIPSDTNGLSFGLTLDSNGSLTTDDLSITDASPTGSADTTAPATSLTAPSGGTTVSGSVTLSATASDNIAVDHVDFLVDGSVVGTAVSGPLSFTWNSRSVANGSHTIAVRAVDTSGNATTTSAITVFVSNQVTNLLQNSSLETASGSTPTCWIFGGSGTNTFTWTRTSDAHTGGFAENVSISSYTSGDRKLVNTQDSGACAPAATVGHSYTVSAWYKGNIGPYIYAYYRNSSGNWVYWAQSTKLATSSTWKQGTWTTPVVPSGATRLSVGMGIAGVSSLTMDDFSLVDNAPPPDTTPPVSTITCAGGASVDSEGACASWYSGPVGITLTATDELGGSGIASIRYTTDGSDPTATNGTVYSGPFTTTTTVKYRAFDNAGNAEAIHTQPISIDSQAPTTTATCNEAPCSANYYASAVSVALSATDAGGSGVRAIYYTTDGSDPTTGNGSVYLGSFSVTSSTTVKFRAFDNAGNAEPVETQVVNIDTVAPSSSISCNSSTCGSSYYTTPALISLAASDAGGSGVAEIVYTTDGTMPTPTNGTVYLTPFTLASTTRVRFRAFDNAGNAEPVNSQLVKVDTVPPTSSISCNAAACSTDPYSSTVTVTLAAQDDLGGSGVASIVYTTDGTDPSQTNGNVYTGSFSVPTSTTVKYRAYDVAGNAEQINSQTIQIAAVAPGVTLTTPSNGATVSGNVQIAATATGMTVDQVQFLVDSQVVATITSAPYSTTWDSTTVANGSHTIAAHAFDTNGQEVDSAPATVTVSNDVTADTTPPTSTITCNQSACISGFYNGSVSVRLSATDNDGGSGVAVIRYTTDGTTPTLTNGTAYGGAFSVASTATVKFRAWDNAGNVEDVNSQLIQIDTVPPHSVVTCNGTACAASYYTSSVSVALSATDNSGGSGVASIVYTTDGSDPTLLNGTAYIGPFALQSTTTVKYRAYDSAGNAEPINSAMIRIDTRPPATTIACNSASCTNAYYKAGVSISLTSSDADSGVSSIRYTTDGTDPSLTNGTVYTSPFTLPATTTIKYRAWDNVGNAEAVQTQVVQVDSIAPTVSLTNPSSGAAVSGTVTLAATASDNVGIDHVDFIVDGTTVSTATSSPYSVAWNSSTVADGTHSVTARAVDFAGNSTTSAAVSISVTNTNLLQNPSLETASGSTPTCWMLGGYGTNTFTWTRTTDAHSGGFAESLTMSSYTSGDRKLVNAQDGGTCAPAVTPGRTYTVTAWYKGSVGPYVFAYYRNSSGSWVYWTQSTRLAVSSSWKQAVWTTPPVPTGATNVSVGLGIDAVGSLTMDDFGLAPAG